MLSTANFARPMGCLGLVLALIGVSRVKPDAVVCMGSCYATTGLQEGSTCKETTASCGGNTWEKLTCHNPTTCLDASLTCRSWDVCSCCSAEPLYKCLLPTAKKAFAPECSSPIDARQQCCGNAITHKRTTDVEEAIKAAINTTTASARAALETSDLDEQISEGLHKSIKGLVRCCPSILKLRTAPAAHHLCLAGSLRGLADRASRVSAGELCRCQS